MKKIISFLQWEFKGCSSYLKSLGFWSVIVVIVAAVMVAAGCPAPWPFYTVMLAFGMFFADLCMAYVQFRIDMRRMQQESQAREFGKQ